MYLLLSNLRSPLYFKNKMSVSCIGRTFQYFFNCCLSSVRSVQSFFCVFYFLFVYSHVTIVPCVTFGSVLKHLPLDIKQTLDIYQIAAYQLQHEFSVTHLNCQACTENEKQCNYNKKKKQQQQLNGAMWTVVYFV